MNSSSAPHRFIALDSLRGVAALAIAYFHLKGDGLLLGSTFHGRLSIAVDFFFVLSGFVIFASYHERLAQGFSTARFMLLRIGRLWPLHIAVILSLVALELLPLVLGGGDNAFTGRRSLETLPANLLLLQTYVHPEGMTWNGPSWSISVELGLYVLAAILLSRIPRIAPFVFAGLALAAGLTLMNVDWKAHPEFAFGVTSVLRGIGGFGFGVFAAWLWLRLPTNTILRTGASWFEPLAALLVIMVIAMPLGMLTNHLVFTLAVFVFAFDAGLISRMLQSRVFVWMGLISYSIYLVHPLVYRFTFRGLNFVERQTGIDLVESAPSGIMQIALYSRIARQDIAALRNAPDYPGPNCTADEARTYRLKLRQIPDEAEGGNIKHSPDFYSLSTFRDLVLHQSEKNFALPEIDQFLNQEGLQFAGFVIDSVWLEEFFDEYPDEEIPGRLTAWDQFEQANPRLFEGMYQFWVTKPAA